MNQTAIDLTPIINVAVQLLGAVLLAVASVAVGYLAKRFKLNNQQALNDIVQQAATNAVNYGLSQAGQLSAAGAFNLQSKSAVIAAAAGYVTTHVPDALKKLGIDQSTVERLVEAKLADAVGVSTVASPDAVIGTKLQPAPVQQVAVPVPAAKR